MEQEEPLPEKKNHNGWVVAILILILIIAAGYGVLMYETYKSKKFIFKEYQPRPPAGQSYFNPLGGVTKLTAQEIKDRNDFIKNNSTPVT